MNLLRAALSASVGLCAYLVTALLALCHRHKTSPMYHSNSEPVTDLTLELSGSKAIRLERFVSRELPELKQCSGSQIHGVSELDSLGE